MDEGVRSGTAGSSGVLVVSGTPLPWTGRNSVDEEVGRLVGWSDDLLLDR